MRTRTMLAAGLTALAVAVSGLSFVVGNSPDATAAAAGLWKIDCGYSHSLPDDPIVHPGRPGASHLHDFFGNVGANASSTYASLKGVTSTCANNDRAAYWAPAVYQNGKKINPTGAIIYYTTSAGAPDKQESFPPDMRIILGNPRATTAAQQQGQIEWGCSDNTQIGRTVPARCASGHIQVRMRFPACWNGVTVQGDAAANLRYPSRGTCPKGFPRALPTMRLNIGYKVGTTTGALTLSSGSVYSIHADFLNSWDQPTLDALVKRCFHGQQNCGRFRGTSPGRAAA
ncbi:MAG TPA: DUF1996 domain-containing protein [Pilimelia sp.]|nr:DUF1996 domain-containing protein [Pilimelia sp.]